MAERRQDRFEREEVIAMVVDDQDLHRLLRIDGFSGQQVVNHHRALEQLHA